MGFWGRLFGRTEYDTTVSDFQATATTSGDFRMLVEDVFTITGRGTVVTGTVESGTLAVGSRVRVTNPSGAAIEATVTGVEMFRKQTSVASAGDNVGLLVDAGTRDDYQRGAVITSLA